MANKLVYKSNQKLRNGGEGIKCYIVEFILVSYASFFFEKCLSKLLNKLHTML